MKAKTELEVFREALTRCQKTDDERRLTEEAQLPDGPCADLPLRSCDNHLVYAPPFKTGWESRIVLHFIDGSLVFAEGWGE